jgi:hypothetical protein
LLSPDSDLRHHTFRNDRGIVSSEAIHEVANSQTLQNSRCIADQLRENCSSSLFHNEQNRKGIEPSLSMPTVQTNQYTDNFQFKTRLIGPRVAL